MNPYVEALLNKSHRSQEAARRNLVASDPETAINRAYYAPYYAASAALLHEGKAAKTHAGVQKQFFEVFVRTGKLDPSISKILTRAFDIRVKSDYTLTTPISMKEAAALIDDVQIFIETVERLTSP